MPVRSTSREAYRKIVRSGVLGRKATKLYSWLYHHGPATGAQVIVALDGHGAVLSQARATITYLRQRGVVQEVGKTKCPITGHTVILWDVTDQLPGPPPNKEEQMTKQELLDELYRIKKLATLWKRRAIECGWRR